jgi:hypothetical protein
VSSFLASHSRAELHAAVEAAKADGELISLLGVFRSNFNQMFVLGRHDPAFFQPLMAALPELRAYLQLPEAR